MTDRDYQLSEQIDRKSSRVICRAIGDRLRQDLGVELSPLPTHLQSLLEEMSRREKTCGPD